MKLKTLLLLFQLLVVYNLSAQIHQVTGGFVSASGYGSEDISMDFSLGQIVSHPIEGNLRGNVGILQVIPSLLDGVEFEFLSDLNIYPNPVNSTLKIDLPCEGSYTMKVTDIVSRLVIESTDLRCSSQVDLSSLETGTYVLTIRQDQNIKSFKVIKL